MDMVNLRGPRPPPDPPVSSSQGCTGTEVGIHMYNPHLTLSSFLGSLSVRVTSEAEIEMKSRQKSAKLLRLLKPDASSSYLFIVRFLVSRSATIHLYYIYIIKTRESKFGLYTRRMYPALSDGGWSATMLRHRAGQLAPSGPSAIEFYNGDTLAQLLWATSAMKGLPTAVLSFTAS